MYGATAGKVSILKIEATTNQAICAILPKEEVFSIYLKFALEDLYKYLVNLSSGSARDNLSQDKIKSLKLIIPEKNILEKFHQIITPSINKIILNLQQNLQLFKLRDWLLPLLMNGQVKIKEAEEMVSMAAEPEVLYAK